MVCTACQSIVDRRHRAVVDGTPRLHRGWDDDHAGTGTGVASRVSARHESARCQSKPCWPVALLVMTHELARGAALWPAVGAMYGAHAASETALVHEQFTQMPADGIALADSGFGIFAAVWKTVAWSAQQTHQDFVLNAADEKNRHGSTIPLRADLANDLRIAG